MTYNDQDSASAINVPSALGEDITDYQTFAVYNFDNFELSEFLRFVLLKERNLRVCIHALISTSVPHLHLLLRCIPSKLSPLPYLTAHCWLATDKTLTMQTPRPLYVTMYDLQDMSASPDGGKAFRRLP